MKLVEVKSTMINRIGFEKNLLQIEFKNDSLYEYSGVEEAVYTDFLQADSKGQFFLANIRPKYLGKKVCL